MLGMAFEIALLAAPAVAGTISLEITAMPEVRDGSLVVSLEVRNVGDEAASSVSPVLRFRGEEVRAEPVPLLPPQQALQTTFTMAGGDRLSPGRWPYAAAVAYADANQYPFHALHAGLVVAGSPPPVQVALLGIEPLQLGATASLEARVKNLSDVPRSVTIRVHLPGGIELEDPPPPVELEPWAEQSVSASLRNRTGLPGSHYGAFVSAEYDEGGVHQALVVPVGIEVVASRSVLERHATKLWVLALLLVLGWVGLVIWRRPARPR